jgi:chemosensory pili system protein ChpA (sensor histidine kinase/response regulator)
VQISSTVGRGTTISLSIPLKLTITRALFVHSAGQLFAIPLEQVARVLRLDDPALDRVRRDGVLRHEGQALRVYNLAAYAGGQEGPPSGLCYGLVVEASDPQTVVLVDALSGTQEAVIKTLGTHLRRVYGVSGATIAGDGRVVLILDLSEVVEAERPARQTPRLGLGAPLRVGRPLHVLVVDDSISVRRVICSFLERAGWQASSAKDGIEALERIAAARPDVALVDIEMPRMNGYELLSRLRADPDLRGVPVVFLTSRSAAKHRERAAELHVDAFLVKPYREDELLTVLREVTHPQRRLT